MVRSAFESGNPDLLPENVKNMEDLATVTKLRILTVDEVGDALMKSFEYDKGSGFGYIYVMKLKMCVFRFICYILNYRMLQFTQFSQTVR